MRRAATALAAVSIALPSLSGDAFAHALAQRYDLPLPLGYFLMAAGAAVTVSFAILALYWRHDPEPKQSTDHVALRGTIPASIVATLQFFFVGALVIIVAAGLIGDQRTFKNITPVAVWVIWWVGFGIFSAFVGNIWALINPWSTVFDFAGAQARRWAKSLSLQLPYPRWLGAWPACALLLLFAWIELVAPGRDVPRNVAAAILIYSGLTWAGFMVFGRDAWLKNGEVFSVLFGLISRFAPLEFTYDGHWRVGLRPIAAGLLTREPLEPSMTAFVLLMLGTVTIDGLMETPPWAAVVEWFLTRRGGVDANPAAYGALQTVLLVLGPLLLAGLYLAVVAMMARIARSNISALGGMFVLSLVPIAIAYHLAHYFSMLMVAGQFIIPLASDPFGYGWDLFGTMLYRIDIGVVDAKFIWYLSIIAIVTGHIVAVWVGHVTACALFRDERIARRSQYPMLVLMVAYTTLSLWILAQPIVEPGAK
jgi:hypothetical protein